jgi:hypothetical protein
MKGKFPWISPADPKGKWMGKWLFWRKVTNLENPNLRCMTLGQKTILYQLLDGYPNLWEFSIHITFDPLKKIPHEITNEIDWNVHGNLPGSERRESGSGSRGPAGAPIFCHGILLRFLGCWLLKLKLVEWYGRSLNIDIHDLKLDIKFEYIYIIWIYI